MTATSLAIPAALRPSDGRFGSGPTKIRREQLAALAATGTSYLGTSHRRDGVRSVVSRVRAGLAELFGLPGRLRGRARQRRRDRVLGHRDVLPDRAALAAPALRRVLREVRRRGRAGAPFLADPIGAHRRAGRRTRRRSPSPASTPTAGRTTRPRPASMTPVARPAGADAGRADPGRRDQRRRRPAGRPARRPTPTTSRRRRPSPPTAGCGSRCSPRPRSSGSPSSRRRAGCPAFARPVASRSTTPARTRPTTPRRSRRCS